MAKSLQKLEAIRLRKTGMSIKDISKAIKISRSGTSVWCRDVVLSKTQKEKLYKRMVDAGHKGRLIGAESNKNKKIEILKHSQKLAEEEIKSLSKRDLEMITLGLYWGEGSKDKQGRFVFVNSDPNTLLLIIHWLKISMNIDKSSLCPQIYINDQHKNREEIVTTFWHKKLKIPKDQFRKTIFIKTPHKKIYANHDTYMGVLHLTVSKSSVLKYKTMALLTEIQKQVQKL